MGKKNVIEQGDVRIERLNADGIIIKDRYTRRPILKVPSLKKLDKL